VHEEVPEAIVQQGVPEVMAAPTARRNLEQAFESALLDTWLNEPLPPYDEVMNAVHQQIDEVIAAVRTEVNDMYPPRQQQEDVPRQQQDDDVPRQQEDVPPQQQQEDDGMMKWELIRKELECPICYEILSQPIMLACGHVFCNACITANSSTPRTEYIKCSLCRKRVRTSNTPLHKINSIIAHIK
jgi:hypothetical protein